MQNTLLKRATLSLSLLNGLHRSHCSLFPHRSLTAFTDSLPHFVHYLGLWDGWNLWIFCKCVYWKWVWPLSIESRTFNTLGFFMILCRINKGVYWCLLEHANTKKHVYEHSCSSVRAFWSILAHLAHLAQSILSDFKYDKWINIFLLV